MSHRLGTKEREADYRYQKTISVAKTRTGHLRSLRRRRIVGIAAGIGLAVALAAGFVYRPFTAVAAAGPTEYRTAFGEQKRIELPDGSTVRLNAHSKLTVAGNWTAATASREVWLEGEAYFSVEKVTTAGAKFVVHAGEVNVEVLGTQFNVDLREEATEVALDEGKIRLYSTTDTTDFTMVPGDVVSVSHVEVRYTRLADVDPTASSSWKYGFLVYHDASLATVLEDIHNTYGYSSIVQDSSVLDEKITGALSATDSDDLLVVLRDILPGLSLVRQGGELIISKQESSFTPD